MRCWACKARGHVKRECPLRSAPTPAPPPSPSRQDPTAQAFHAAHTHLKMMAWEARLAARFATERWLGLEEVAQRVGQEDLPNQFNTPWDGTVFNSPVPPSWEEVDAQPEVGPNPFGWEAEGYQRTKEAWDAARI
ncbi:hypothetical protein BV25DRAFT_1917198 [Artomyces pyxidatus]|uniref:Uncharacterized protein n=1 Tax=Artomyces pyxidatus TaxID=48021 RepID=A0ACB8SWR6_9AGAM|nr:hypothetical protein BV25DRAFT_1917198 [Artomyces pyxidatus]